MRYKLSRSLLLLIASFVSLSIISNSRATAASLQLVWLDNSSNETGFRVERKLGTAGIYTAVATTGANVTSYADSTLADSTTYCYRVNAFNSAGNSPYSPEACSTTPAPPVTTYSLTLARQGSGTVTSTPSGINCGTTCAATFSSGAAVTLQAVAATGYTFTGWGGDADCLDGAITMGGNKSCTATFTANPVVPTSYTLTVSTVGTITAAGSGSGKIVSSPTGIDCGTKCSATFSSGSIITLQAIPAAGSTFTGWSGTGCTNGVVTMNANTTCTATFNPLPSSQTFTLSIVKLGTGTGTVTSTPAGINCGSSCSGTYNSGTTITLTATLAAGSTFAGWSGTGCTAGTVTLNGNTTCTATFQTSANQLATRIGIFRPSTGEWFLDDNGNGQWDQTSDVHITSFGHDGDLPVIGTWSGSGISNIGTFTPATGTWQLDTNGDGILDCAVDTCISSFGQPGDLPVTREISGLTGSIIGTFTPQTTVIVQGRKVVKRGLWNFDLNGNSTLDGCSIDECDTFGTVGELPVVGDWNGTGTEEIGIFLPSKGQWYLDLNGNGIWDGCRVDKCFGAFGTKGDLPVVGDWDGTGKVRIGAFRPSTGQWFLDMNGNGKLDSCTVDACLGPFGQPGDLPVVGKW